MRPRSFFSRIGNTFMFAVHTVVPPGGILASAFNMASASIGAGILGLPGATNTCGLLLAMIYLLVITYLSVFSMHVLAIATQKTRLKTFEGLARWLFPQYKYAFSYVVAALRCFYSFSACVAYVISMGNCCNAIFTEALKQHPGNSAIEFFSNTTGNRVFAFLVWFCIMLPLAIPKHIDSLRYASTIAVLLMVFFGLVIIVHSCMNGLPKHAHNVIVSDQDGITPGPNIYLFRTGNNVLQSVGVFVFAYVCQNNGCEIWWDMSSEKRTIRNYTWASIISMFLVGTLYALVCIFAYFDFGSEDLKNESILLRFSPLKEPVVMIAYIGVFVKLCVAYALMGLAARNSMYYMIGWQHKYRTEAERNVFVNIAEDEENKSATTPADANHNSVKTEHNNEEDARREEVLPSSSNTGDNGGKKNFEMPAMDEEEEEEDFSQKHNKSHSYEKSYIDNIPMWKHVLVVFTLGVVILLCGLFIPNINTVLGFAGAISGGGMAFIFPALYYMYAGNFSVKESGWFNYLNTYALLICGVVGVVFGTGGSIYSAAVNGV